VLPTATNKYRLVTPPGTNVQLLVPVGIFTRY
jgi:hypothetical protein